MKNQGTFYIYLEKYIDKYILLIIIVEYVKN